MIQTVVQLRRPPDRRSLGRVSLDHPLRAWLGEQPVRVLDASLDGFCIAHEDRLKPGAMFDLRVDWDGLMMHFRCELRRTQLFRLAKSPSEKSVYRSGVHIVRSYESSASALRALVERAVSRALDEQVANARGIPPETHSYALRTCDRYRRCELVGGVWRQTETTNPQQPRNGFTISADVSPYHVSMLCLTWEQASDDDRRFTQMLAELSVSGVEGVPTRRYDP